MIRYKSLVGQKSTQAKILIIQLNPFYAIRYIEKRTRYNISSIFFTILLSYKYLSVQSSTNQKIIYYRNYHNYIEKG